MHGSFYTWLCTTPAGSRPAAASSRRLAGIPSPEELRAQIRHLLAARKTPLPASEQAELWPDGSPLERYDRLLTYGMEQPLRIPVNEQRDVRDLGDFMRACILRNIPSVQEVEVIEDPNAPDPGRTVVPVKIRVKTQRQRNASLEISLDRLSRDVDMSSQEI